MGLCRNIIIFLLVNLIAILIGTDICAVVMPSVMKSDCSNTTLCIDRWIASYGIISIFFNYFRLVDLIALIDAHGSNIIVSLSHLVCRISFDIILILFHLTEAIIGIIIFRKDLLPGSVSSYILYDYNIVAPFTIVAIITNICWAMFAGSFIYFKCSLLKINDQSNP